MRTPEPKPGDRGDRHLNLSSDTEALYLGPIDWTWGRDENAIQTILDSVKTQLQRLQFRGAGSERKHDEREDGQKFIEGPYGTSWADARTYLKIAGRSRSAISVG